MNDLQKFIERLKSIVPEGQIHIINYHLGCYLSATNIQLSNFPDWPLIPTNVTTSTIYFETGKPSSIDVEVVVGVDSLHLELDPEDPDVRPGIPVGYIDRDVFMDRGVTGEVYEMFRSYMPPGFELFIEEFVVNLREAQDLRLRLRGTKKVKDEDEFFYILKNLSRPMEKQDWYKEGMRELQGHSTPEKTKDEAGR